MVNFQANSCLVLAYFQKVKPIFKRHLWNDFYSSRYLSLEGRLFASVCVRFVLFVWCFPWSTVTEWCVSFGWILSSVARTQGCSTVNTCFGGPAVNSFAPLGGSKGVAWICLKVTQSDCLKLTPQWRRRSLGSSWVQGLCVSLEHSLHLDVKTLKVRSNDCKLGVTVRITRVTTCKFLSEYRNRAQWFSDITLPLLFSLFRDWAEYRWSRFMFEGHRAQGFREIKPWKLNREVRQGLLGEHWLL